MRGDELLPISPDYLSYVVGRLESLGPIRSASAPRAACILAS
ncbi:MAG: hypothetical protein WAQ33_17025 [Gaiellaceae bacterium]